MDQIREKTVRDIAIENPANARVLEELGIDYCCGGSRKLGDACSLANVPVERAAELLMNASRQAPEPEDAGWNRAPLAALAAHIVSKHHAFVRGEIPRIEALLAKVVKRHVHRHPELASIERRFAMLGQELSTHMLKEEQVLFPFIVRMEAELQAGKPLPPAFFGSVKRPIAQMAADHDGAGALLLEMRQASDDYALPEGACLSYRTLYCALQDFERDLHQHVHLENNLLFPRAIEMENAALESADAGR